MSAVGEKISDITNDTSRQQVLIVVWIHAVLFSRLDNSTNKKCLTQLFTDMHIKFKGHWGDETKQLCEGGWMKQRGQQLFLHDQEKKAASRNGAMRT